MDFLHACWHHRILPWSVPTMTFEGLETLQVQRGLALQDELIRRHHDERTYWSEWETELRGNPVSASWKNHSCTTSYYGNARVKGWYYRSVFLGVACQESVGIWMSRSSPISSSELDAGYPTPIHELTLRHQDNVRQAAQSWFTH